MITCIPRIQINTVDELVKLYTVGLLPGMYPIPFCDHALYTVINAYVTYITYGYVVLGKPMSRIMSMLVGEHISSIKDMDFNVRTPAPPVLKQ